MPHFFQLFIWANFELIPKTCMFRTFLGEAFHSRSLTHIGSMVAWYIYQLISIIKMNHPWIGKYTPATHGFASELTPLNKKQLEPKNGRFWFKMIFLFKLIGQSLGSSLWFYRGKIWKSRSFSGKKYASPPICFPAEFPWKIPQFNRVWSVTGGPSRPLRVGEIRTSIRTRPSPSVSRLAHKSLICTGKSTWMKVVFWFSWRMDFGLIEFFRGAPWRFGKKNDVHGA